MTPPDRLPRGGRGEALPRLLVAVDGRTFAELPPTLAAAAFLRDLDLAGLVAVAERGAPFAVDLNSVDGLSADGAAVRFVVAELGIPVVASAARASPRRRSGGEGAASSTSLPSTRREWLEPSRRTRGSPGRGRSCRRVSSSGT